MACNCNENVDCGCQIKDLATKCVVYTGGYLTNLNISTNTDLTTLIKAIDYKFQSEATTYVNVINLGTGVGIYKGTYNLNTLGFKSLKSTDTLLNIQSATDEVNLSINREELNELILEEVSPTTYVFGSQSTVNSYNPTTNTLSFKNIIAGTNVQINHGTNDITISATAGGSTSVIESDTLIVLPITGGYKIDTPKDFVRRFYVNNTYSGSNPDGTISKPFTSVAQAITAYIGTGTYLNPQFSTQGVIIYVQRTGVGHLLPNSLLVKNLNIYLEEGVTLQNSNASATEYLIDFDSLPSSESRFQITISGANNTTSFISSQRPFCRNTGYGVGSSDNSFSGRNLKLSKVRLTRVGTTSMTNYFVSTQENYFTLNHNNNQAPFNFSEVDFRGNTSTPMFYLGNSNNMVFINCKFYFSDSLETSTGAIYPFYWGGNYARFENCHFICYNNFVNGVFFLKNGGNQGLFEMFNCSFEGNTSNLITFANDATKQRLNIRGATPFFQSYGKVINSPSGDVITATMMDNIFSSPKGDVDLTMNNTISVMNYFNNRLTESLIRSATVLNRANYPEGTAYIYTANSANQVDWKRLVVF